MSDQPAPCWTSHPVTPNIVLPCFWERLKAKTTHLSLAEKGAYWWLLMHQWQHGYVPALKHKQMAQIMGTTTAHARTLWGTLSAFFTDACPCGCGLRRNRSMEEKRADQLRRSNVASENAAKRYANHPAKLPANEGAKQGAKDPAKTLLPSTKYQEPDPPSVPLKLDPTTTIPSVAADKPVGRVVGGLLMNSLNWEQKREKFAYFGARLRIPHVLHDELRNKLGGANPQQRLEAWYHELDAEAELSGETISDIFEWLRPKFIAWVSDAMADAELARFRPKGA